MEFVADCMSDWFVNWEQECTISLLSSRESESIVLAFQRSELTRGNDLQQAQANSLRRNGGWASSNDIRDDEGKNRIPAAEGGDLYLLATNMAPLATAMDEEATPSADANGNDKGDDPQADDPAAAKKAKAKKAAKKEQNRSAGWITLSSMVNGAPPVPTERPQ